MRIDFYHLSTAPIERVLPQICEKVLGRGERLVVVALAEQLERLDRELWTYDEASFLPHGIERPESQPILVAAEPVPTNGAGNVALADGMWRDEALSFERVLYFFDSATVEGARAAWRALQGREGTELRYWKQEGGKWLEGP